MGSKKSREKEELIDELFEEFTQLMGKEILIITESSQLNLLGQTFRPIFVGPIVEVEMGHITLFPATIKLLNAPFFQFPTPLSIPFEKITQFTPDFDSDMRFPLI
ncbi:hypothetical protein [Jeotgalibacillus soli]|uniref:Uncharacterized protein n=1 Tax=Jeotgalibacillus soli TaxID=889306 RepID=A0A0C2SDH4_9BACL|nr:hypothetical protein [Jeotgalibacillus soli]KIL51999.1 hypothetical protein KP78_03690 [Jeotgalibacillus soli]